MQRQYQTARRVIGPFWRVFSPTRALAAMARLAGRARQLDSAPPSQGDMIRGMVETRPAGFWIRAAALAIDVAIFLIVKLSFDLLGLRIWGREVGSSMEFVVALWTFTFVFTAVYTTVLHALFGQTVGKMVVGVRVMVGDDGAPPPFGASLLRFCAYSASLATFGFGYVMAGLRHDKRALHDLIAGTRVERDAPRTPVRERRDVAPPPAPA